MLEKLQFERDGFFYRMVTSYMMGICGCLVFHSRTVLPSPDLVRLASIEYGALEIKPREVTELLRNGNMQLSDLTDSLAYMLVNSAYEAVADYFDDSKWPELRLAHPELEFFRHVRNAASHGGTWNFKSGEPRRTAKWRGREITRDLQDQPIWAANLKPGDLLVLLWDVEQILKASPGA